MSQKKKGLIKFAKKLSHPPRMRTLGEEIAKTGSAWFWQALCTTSRTVCRLRMRRCRSRCLWGRESSGDEIRRRLRDEGWECSEK